MKIDHLNSLLDGGAAVAARRIHDGLARLGVESRFWYGRGDQATVPDASYRPMVWEKANGGALSRAAEKLRAQVRRVMQKFAAKYYLSGHPQELELFSPPMLPRTTRLDRRALDGSALHLHWVAKMFDFSSFFASLPATLPIVWTLHDPAPLTGGCHYTVGCRAFESECGACPLLGRPRPKDLAWQGFQVKKAALAGKNLHVVGSSRWITEEARRSALFAEARSIRRIPYGLDVQAFAPRDRRAMREQLDLPQDKSIIAFGADSIHNLRKGLGPLLQALARLEQKDRVVGVFFGKGDLPAHDSALPELRSVGFLSTSEQQSRLYAAADLFAIPSLEEAFGQTGLEALACGTPVVGFNTGGIPDYVRPGETGLLANVGDVDDLARQMQALIDRPEEARRMGRRGREIVLAEYDMLLAARQYAQLYAEIAPENSTSARAA